MLQALKTRYWPPVPAEIRDELAVLRYARLQQQIPILYLTLIAVVLTAMLAATSGAPWWARVGIPLFFDRRRCRPLCLVDGSARDHR